MDRRDVQLSLVHDLLAAPGSDAGWQTFLRNLCDALGGSAASFLSHDFTSSHTAISVTARTAPEAVAAYGQHWHQFDPWSHSPAAARSRSGAVLFGDQLLSRTELRRTPFYNEFGRHYGIADCLAGIIEVSPRALSCISINAPNGRRPFESADAALLEGLMQPLQSAIAIHRRLSGAELMALHSSAVLDRLPHGVLLVGANGAVLSTNRAADEILALRDGLSYERGELRAATVGDTLRLRTSVKSAFALQQTGSCPAADIALRLPRPSGRRCLSVLVAPLPLEAARPPAESNAVVMFVTDPDRLPVAEEGTIRSVFNLTAAEARLVRCLVQGLSLTETAERLDLQLDTVRSRLKIVFQKTGTHRQSDLMRLVLSSLAPGS